MAEPTLKDVLKAIASVAVDLAEVRRQMATKDETSARFDRVDRQLAELDRDLDGHMTVHRDLEKDVAALKKQVAALKAGPRATRTARRR